MPVVKLKPTSPGRRAMVKVVNPTLHKGRPIAGLTESKKRGSGRNNLGHITVRTLPVYNGENYIADAGYGEVGEFRQGLDDREIGYVVQVKADTSAYPEQVRAFGISGHVAHGFKRLFMTHPPLAERIEVLKRLPAENPSAHVVV